MIGLLRKGIGCYCFLPDQRSGGEGRKLKEELMTHSLPYCRPLVSELQDTGERSSVSFLKELFPVHNLHFIKCACIT